MIEVNGECWCPQINTASTRSARHALFHTSYTSFCLFPVFPLQQYKITRLQNKDTPMCLLLPIPPYSMSQAMQPLDCLILPRYPSSNSIRRVATRRWIRPQLGLFTLHTFIQLNPHTCVKWSHTHICPYPHLPIRRSRPSAMSVVTPTNWQANNCLVLHQLINCYIGQFLTPIHLIRYSIHAMQCNAMQFSTIQYNAKVRVPCIISLQHMPQLNFYSSP